MATSILTSPLDLLYDKSINVSFQVSSGAVAPLTCIAGSRGSGPAKQCLAGGGDRKAPPV